MQLKDMTIEQLEDVRRSAQFAMDEARAAFVAAGLELERRRAEATIEARRAELTAELNALEIQSRSARAGAEVSDGTG